MEMTDEGCDLLRNAIVAQAAKDYKKVVKQKKRHPKYGVYNKEELDSFFGSQWFEWLTDLDGEYIIKEIKKIYGKK